ncbi:hypothetical protein AB0B28_12405 [Glycomyces sp. NPDC046736]|uniref:hypothetical protein n=1 Tax=Glycomyces sp. NPDC046736 TaxID=3155615 RepID=UPI0033C2FF01
MTDDAFEGDFSDAFFASLEAGPDTPVEDQTGFELDFDAEDLTDDFEGTEALNYEAENDGSFETDADEADFPPFGDAPDVD